MPFFNFKGSGMSSQKSNSSVKSTSTNISTAGAKNNDLAEAKLNWGSLKKSSASLSSGWGTTTNSDSQVSNNFCNEEINRNPIKSLEKKLNSTNISNSLISIEEIDINIPNGAVLGYYYEGRFIPLPNISYKTA